MSELQNPVALHLARDARRLGARVVREPQPTLHRVRRGVRVDAKEWADAGFVARYATRMRAVAATRHHEPVFSHVSAAIEWGLPIVGPHLQHVHLAADGRRGVHSKNGVVWHHDAITTDDVVERRGVLVTSLERTVRDIACVLPFASAVAVLDHVFRDWIELPDGTRDRGIDQDRFVYELVVGASRRGIRAARAAAAFADPAAESPGESVSRAHMHVMHFPTPVLQARFPRADGSGDDVSDFDWPELDRFGEFDGVGKYIREEFTRGRSTADVVLDEKRREDRIRRHRSHAVRWDWRIALSPRLLREHLIAHGIHPTR